MSWTMLRYVLVGVWPVELCYGYSERKLEAWSASAGHKVLVIDQIVKFFVGFCRFEVVLEVLSVMLQADNLHIDS